MNNFIKSTSDLSTYIAKSFLKEEKLIDYHNYHLNQDDCTLYKSLKYLRGIARKPRSFTQDLAQSIAADIFIVGRPNMFRKELKISTQMDKPVWR